MRGYPASVSKASLGRVRPEWARLAGSFLLVSAFLAASAVGAQDSPAKPVGSAAAAWPPSIYVQGDSLTVDAAPHLRRLAAPARVTIDAKIGRHAWEGVALIRRKIATMPNAVVVALGTNDDFDRTGVSLFRTHVNSIMNLLGRKRCVVWTTIYEKPKPPKRGRPAPTMVYAGLNQVIDETAKQWRNIRRVPWAEIAARNPLWFRYDSVHPTDAGYAERARQTVAALRRCPSWTRSANPGDGAGGTTPGA